MNKVVMQEGYTLPFAGHSRRRRRSGQQSKMGACARKWKHHRGSGSYKAFMKKCLKSR